MSTATPTTLLTFPCSYPIKIMGRRTDTFAQDILAIVIHHAPDFVPASMEMRPSKQGKYLGLTVTINAHSREQLDALYQALCAHQSVAMVL
jgi:hypothetical protein